MVIDAGRKRLAYEATVLKMVQKSCEPRTVLPDCRPERIDEVLRDWAENYDELDIEAVKAELKHLFHEQKAEERRKEMAAR